LLGDGARAGVFADLDPAWSGGATGEGLIATLYKGEYQAASDAFAALPGDKRALVSKAWSIIAVCLGNTADAAAFATGMESSLMGVRDSEAKYQVGVLLEVTCRGQASASTLHLLERAAEQGFCAVDPLDRVPALAALRRNPGFPPVRAQTQRCRDAFEAHRAGK
jgi:hypothetical protein